MTTAEHFAPVGEASWAHKTTGTGVTSDSVTPPIQNLKLRKLVIAITEDAMVSVAGECQLVFSLNGQPFFSEGLYIPATSGVNAGEAYHRDLPFDGVAFFAGLGDLSWTLSKALTAGQMDVNAYFG